LKKRDKCSMKKLLEKLTIKEKIGQLLQIAPFFFIKDLKVEVAGPVEELNLDEEKIFLAGSVLGIGSASEMVEVQKKYLSKSRHQIPLLFMADIIHGYKTIFPVPIAMASSFHPQLAELCARVSAIEASTSGVQVTFSPMADLSRDPRWGRVVEGFGEDPYLAGEMARFMVKGYIGDGIEKAGNVASCVKHFAGYGASEAGRDYNTVDLSRISLFNQYLPAYKKAIDAGSSMVMTSFNTIDQVPCTVNSFLLRDVLRKKWHFKGVTISDYDSLKQIMAHGVAENMEEVAYKGIQGGLDIEMSSSAYANHLESLIQQGKVDIRLLDEAVLRILELKQACGLFEDPYKGADVDLSNLVVLSKEHLQASLRVALESMVLLQNDGILPLSSTAKIALIGPYANSKDTIGPWSWHGRRDLHPSLADVLQDSLVFVDSKIDVDQFTDFDIQLIKQADVIILALGEAERDSGEAHSKSQIVLPQIQQRLFEFIHSLQQKTVTLVFSGRPLILTPYLASNALLECWFLGSESSQAIKDTLFGLNNPSGKLPISFPRNEGQIPIYYNHLNTGRPYLGPHDYNEFVSRYLDVENTPLFPFGFGLSYCQFRYTNMSIDRLKLSNGETLTAKVQIHNQSQHHGYETVLLFIRDIVANISRPVQELKQFQKIWFEPDEIKTISFQISTNDLTYQNELGETILEDGLFQVMIGASSANTMQTTFQFVSKA